jgi:hypothetical protein
MAKKKKKKKNNAPAEPQPINIGEVSQQGQVVVGYDGATPGASDGIAISGDVCVSPGRSPVYCVLDGTSNVVLQVPAEVQ